MVKYDSGSITYCFFKGFGVILVLSCVIRGETPTQISCPPEQVSYLGRNPSGPPTPNLSGPPTPITSCPPEQVGYLGRNPSGPPTPITSCPPEQVSYLGRNPSGPPTPITCCPPIRTSHPNNPSVPPGFGVILVLSCVIRGETPTQTSCPPEQVSFLWRNPSGPPTPITRQYPQVLV